MQGPTAEWRDGEPHELDDGFVFWPESLGPRPGPALVRVGTASRASRRPRRPLGRRVVVAAGFTSLFFAGAAFTASAGNQLAGVIGATKVSGDVTGAVKDAAVSPAAAPVVRKVQVPAAPASAVRSSVQHASVGATHAAQAVAAASAGSTQSAVAPIRAAVAPRVVAPVTKVTPARVLHARHTTTHPASRMTKHAHVQAPLVLGSVGAPPIEVAPSGPAFWESVTLPDPIPAALRLDQSFAHDLRAEAARAGVSWALVLGVARAQGGTTASPLPQQDVAGLAAKLAAHGGSLDEWGAAKAVGGSSEFADRAVALARFDRAVGLGALVHGLAAEKEALAQRVLDDPRVWIYDGGRDDLVQGHVDVRVLAVVEYLAETFGKVSISSLITGHREWARPGVVSAHVYGRAMDVAALDGVSIFGHQQRGSVTERGVRSLLLLPPEVAPKQVISLIGMGGPSFALADHYDHIHVGF